MKMSMCEAERLLMQKNPVKDGISYVLTIASFDSCILRVPSKVRAGMVRFTMKNSDWNKALTTLAHYYHQKRDSIFSFELLASEIGDDFSSPTAKKQNEVDLAKLSTAFKGSNDYYKKFNLWDWKDTTFVIARPAVRSNNAR